MMEFNLYFEGATRSGAMFLFTTISISSVCYAFRKRFPITKHLTSYILTIGANVLVYIINIWGDQRIWTSPPVVLPWLTAVFVIANLYYVARMYYTSIGIKSEYSCHAPLADNGTLFPLASRSGRFQCRAVTLIKHCRVRPNGVGHAPASETTPHGEPCDFRISPAQTRL